MQVATAAEHRDLERLATSKFGIKPQALMESAAEAAARFVQETYNLGTCVVIVCGKGNNGGDGLALARLLIEAYYSVHCVCVFTEGEASDLCAAQLKQAQQVGVNIYWDELRILNRATLVVDALLGIGAKGEVTGIYRTAIEAMNDCKASVLSLDVPSGIDADTGISLGCSVKADYTLTFGLPKPCLFQNDGLEATGHWWSDPIAFPKELVDEPRSVHFFTPDEAKRLEPERPKNAHKGSSGHVLVVAGSDQMPGAATLCCLGALRAGAGLVTLASTPAVCQAVGYHLPEVLFSNLDAESLLAQQDKISAAVFGPGLSQSDEVAQLLNTVWAGWKKPCVVDADALNLIASKKVKLPETDCVITPHPGEAARLLPEFKAPIQQERLKAIRDLLVNYKCASVLKGAYSMVGTLSQPISINPTGNPGMAAGGMGDVLSGVIGTLVAQGLSTYDAARLGTYLHGLAGDYCAQNMGPVGFLASDLAHAIPHVR